MASRKGGLGKGFEALFADNSTEELSSASVSTLPVGELEPNHSQPRKAFDEQALSELAESIKVHGVLQPLLVRPLSGGGYQIVAGERRYRAARIAGLAEVPVVIKVLTDEETALIALIENLQREDLSPFEEAEGMLRLTEDYGMTQEAVAHQLGKSRPAVANALRLLAVPAEIREMVENKELTAGHARALLSIGEEKQMLACAREVRERALSVRETEKLVKKYTALPKIRPPKKRHAEPFYTEAELSLSQTLGRGVEIKEGKKGGKLIVEFFDKEDLQKLAKALGEGC